MSAAERRLRIDLAYDGTEFAGWQFQTNQRTVQGVLERALAELQGGGSVRVRGAGRTDAGVHARGQVADCELRSRLDDAELEHSLRRLLPADVRPLGLRTVPQDFHSQKCARAKTYRYRLDLTLHGDPFRARFALHHPQPLDLARVEDGLERLRGRHDWSGFTGTACTVEDRVRTITRAVFEAVGEHEAVFTFTADGYLRYMVRNLVGTLLLIGRGRMPPDQIDRILETGSRDLAGPTAPAKALCLEHVAY